MKYPTISGLYEKWGIWWCDFPDPVGRHPAIIISNDVRLDYKSSVQVFIIRSKTDFYAKVEEQARNFCVPIMLYPDRESLIVCNDVISVDKSLLVCRIGTMIDLGARKFITSCFTSIMTGSPISEYVPTANHPYGYTPEHRLDILPTIKSTMRGDVIYRITGDLLESIYNDEDGHCPDVYGESFVETDNFEPDKESTLILVKSLVSAVKQYKYSVLMEYQITSTRVTQTIETLRKRNMLPKDTEYMMIGYFMSKED